MLVLSWDFRKDPRLSQSPGNRVQLRTDFIQLQADEVAIVSQTLAENTEPQLRDRELYHPGAEDPVSLVLPSASSASQPQRDGDSGWPYMCKP